MIIRFAKFYLILLLSLFFATASQVHATVEWSIQNTLKTIARPIDVAVFPDGRSIFVLTDDGNVLIYDEQGKLTDTIPVGTHVDQIKIDPQGERLFAASRQNKTVEVITLDFVRDINISGAPFKGLPDAPVIITVFSDFQ
jgi:hypothetical protein